MNGLSSENWILAGFVVFAFMAGPRLAEVRADEGIQRSDRSSERHPDKDVVVTVLQRYCFDCHAEDTQEAGLRFDSLDFSSDNASDATTFEAIMNMVASGQMPPEGAQRPSADERRVLTSWLARRLDQLAHARRSGHWTRNRRLTNDEYHFTMQSLFGVDAEFADGLPPDPVSQDGFQNNGELLGLSPLQMECYLDSARRAVERYVQFGEPAEQPVRYHIELEDLYYTTADRYGTRKRAPQPLDREAFETRRAASLGSAPQYAGPFSPVPPGAFSTDEALRAAIPKLHQQYVALPEFITTSGEMIVRLRAAGTPDRNGRFPRLRVEAGITLGDGCSMDKRLLGEVDVTAPLDEPAVYSFRIRMEDVPTKGPLRDEDAFDPLSVFDMMQLFLSNASRDERAIFGLGRGGYPATKSDRVEAPHEQMSEAGVNFLHLDFVEIEMLPRITADGPYDWSVDAARAEQGKDEQWKIASDFLRKFMQRAYRRPVSEAELAGKMELFRTLRDRGDSFEESLRETLAAVLVSPPFLFLESCRPGGEASDGADESPYALASRLSYFLWLAPPDQTLLNRAADGSLLKRDVLASEAKRLLEDSRSRRFLDSFCRQWLRLDKHRNVAVDRNVYPDYDEDLAATMIDETLHYFAEVFASDSSALDLISSDYAILNDRLADHYGLEGVPEGELQKVRLPEESIRGGLLTQASLLTMNADGVDSHPIRRGVWLLDRLLNSPPPPPPPNVPEIDNEDPDFQGLSLKERIVLHRSPGACQSCHRKIDPWGLAFENFDATGRWRETVHDLEGKEQSSPVDAAVELPDGQEIDGVGQLKRYLQEEYREQFGRALAHHMLTYALGRSLDFADRPQVESIHQRFAASEYRLKELVLAIVDSKAFSE